MVKSEESKVYAQRERLWGIRPAPHMEDPQSVARGWAELVAKGQAASHNTATNNSALNGLRTLT